MSCALIIMAKRPQPGSTKTRLTPALTPEAAAGLYEAMLGDIVEVLSARRDATVMIAAGSDGSASWFEDAFPGVPVVLQGVGSLGERLDRVLGDALESGFESVFAISSDSPDLPAGHLREAFALIDREDVDIVLGPSEDGGYWTVGWKQRWTASVVDVTMSRPDVLERTQQIAAGLGARVALAPEWYDVDEIGDVERLRASLPSERLPRLSQFLEGLALTATTAVPESESLAPLRVSVVIPALDEAENIATVVDALRAPGLVSNATVEVIVADNGSTDDTAERARAAGAVVVHEPRKGYGYACAAGTEEALTRQADIIAYIDGDQSSRPTELRQLVDPVRTGAARLALGSRTIGEIAEGAMPPHQRAGNVATAGLMRLLYRVPVTDLGPYRAIDARLISELDMTEMTFGWPTEMMVKTAARGERIVEVPVSWDVRVAGSSKVGGTIKGSLLAGWHILSVTLRHARAARSGATTQRGTA